MSNDRLIQRAVRHPQLGIYGTFSIVAMDADQLEFEFLTVVCKDRETGKIYSPCRPLFSRKTVESRRVFFNELLKLMVQHVLQDPFQSDGFQRLSLVSDFETKFSIAFCHALVELFQPKRNLIESIQLKSIMANMIPSDEDVTDMNTSNYNVKTNYELIFWKNMEFF